MATNIKRSQSLAVSIERRVMCRVSARAMASGEPTWPIPMKAIGAQNLLTMPGGVTISGYLHKRGGKHFQLLKWPLRYVIIHKGCVYYFKTSTSPSSQGAFSLNGYDRVMRAAEETTSSNVFPFKLVHISKKHRTWYFSAASEDERKKWMFSIRKEIDRYQEKKETITDFSQSDSESASFYDSVERPLQINYTHNSADDSWEDDEDEDDYEQPDEATAPPYPPPPVPRAKNGERRGSFDMLLSDSHSPKHFVPLPPTKPSISDIKDVDLTHSRKDSWSDMGPKPPPVPAAVHKIKEPFPIVSIPGRKTSNDTTEKEVTRPRKESRCPLNYDKAEAPFPLPPQQSPHRTEPPPVPPPSRRTPTDSEPKVTKRLTHQPYDAGLNNLSRELNKQFRMAHVPSQNTPVPLTKPAVDISTITPSKPPPLPPSKSSVFKPAKAVSPMPPVPPNKPKLIGSPDKGPSLDNLKTVMPKCPTIQKPPPPLWVSGKNSTMDKPTCSPILRSPPDGQSFRGFNLEAPIIPVKPKMSDVNVDSDDDYEKVPLPTSVFVETTESNDIERMFKASCTRGNPENGLFCIRNSARSGKVLVVWDAFGEKVRNYRIFEKDRKLYLEADIMFTDIGTLVEHYYENKLPSPDNLYLRHAFGCPSSLRVLNSYS
ncbi:SH3 domain-binding protein 2 [Pelodytes ibericus]